MVYDFTIVYERKNRELENAILLKIELERRGYVVRVVNYYEVSQYKFLCFNKTRVLIVPHLYSNKSVWRNIARYGSLSHIVNLQYEQVLNEKWEKLGHHNPKGEALKGIHICWGNKTVRRLQECGVPHKNIKLLGPLGFDLLKYKKENSTIIKNYLGNRNNLDITKRWVLFLSSFSFADINKHHLEGEERVAGTSLKGHVSIHTQSRNKIIEWFEKILQKDNKSIIIYRPHPSEANVEPVKYLEHKFSNFKVVNNSSAKYWIMASDKNYTWYSTSIIESHLLHKPYAILRPYELPKEFDVHIFKGAQFIHTYANFEENFFESNSAMNNSLKVHQINDYYDLKSEKLSVMRYCDELELIFKKIPSENFHGSYKLKFISKIKLIPLLALYICFKLFKIKKDVPLYRWIKMLDSQIANEKEKIETVEKLRLFLNVL